MRTLTGFLLVLGLSIGIAIGVICDAASAASKSRAAILKCSGTGTSTGTSNLPRLASEFQDWAVIYKIESPKTWKGWNAAEGIWDDTNPVALVGCTNDSWGGVWRNGGSNECALTPLQDRKSVV